MTMNMKQEGSCQGWSANAEQLRKTAQQINRTLKNDLKSLKKGMSSDNWKAKCIQSVFQRQRTCRNDWGNMSYAFKSTALSPRVLHFLLIIPWPFFNFNAFHGPYQRKASYNFKALDGKKKRPQKLQRGDNNTCKINVFGNVYS